MKTKITVKELLEELKDVNPNVEIDFCVNRIDDVGEREYLYDIYVINEKPSKYHKKESLEIFFGRRI